MSDHIFYKAGYKYQLTRDYAVQTGIFVPEEIVYPFFTLKTNGVLMVCRGYAWDGASGPTFDTKSSMRPSLVHDCFCQMAKDRKIDYKTYAPQYNELFKRMCIEDGMWPARAALWKAGVIVGRGGDPEIADDVLEQVAP
jgi:hypothetical protein